MPPNTRPAAISMMTMRLVIRFVSVLGVRPDSLRAGHSLDQGRYRALVLGNDVRAVPPAAAERLEQGRRVRQPRGLRLHQREAGLLVGALCVEQRQIGDGTDRG